MKIEIDLKEYETVRNALAERPFKEVVGLIAKLDQQVIEQNRQESEEKLNG